MSTISFVTTLQRKDPRLPLYVVVPGALVCDWQLAGTTVVDGVVNGQSLGRRTLKAWGKGSPDWFFDLPKAWCSAAGLTTGDPVTVSLQRADMTLPPELEQALARSPELASAWRALPPRWQRELSEHVRSAKTANGRLRRAGHVVSRITSETAGR